MASLGKAFVEVKADLDGFPADLRRKLAAALKEGVAGVDFDGLDKKAEAAGSKAADSAGRGFSRQSKTVFRKAGDDGGNSLAEGILSSVAKTLSTRAVLLGGIIQGVIGAAVALAVPAAGLLASLPAFIGAAVSSAVALKLAFSGVGDAIKAAASGDAAKLAEAMKNLAPEARAFVQEFSQVKPIFTELRKSVQGGFFAEFNGSLRQIATDLVPTLATGLRGVSTILGSIGRSFAGAFGDPAIKAALLGTIGNAVSLLLPFKDVLGQIARAFIFAADAAGPFLTALAQGAGSALGTFSAFLTRISTSGALADFLNQALEALRVLGDIGGSVISVVGSVFAAFGGAGNQVLGIIAQLVSQIAAFFQTAAGFGVLKGLVDVIGAIGQVLGAVLAPLLPVLAQLLTSLLGPLASILTGLAGPLGAFAAALGGELLVAAQALIPFIVTLAEQLGGFLGAALIQLAGYITTMLPVLMQFAQTIGPTLVPLVMALFQALYAILPIIPPLAQAFLQMYLAVLPALPAFVQLIGLATQLIIALTPIIEVLVQVITWLLQLDAAIIAFSVEGIVAAIQFLISYWTFLIDAGAAVVTFFTETLPNAFMSVVNGIGSTLATFFGTTLPEFFTSLPGKIGAALAALPGILWNAFTTALDFALQAIGFGIGLILLAIFALPGLIWAGLQALPGLLASLWNGIWATAVGIWNAIVSSVTSAASSVKAGVLAAINGARDFFIQGASAIISFAVALPGRIGSAISALPGILRGAFNSAMEAAKSAVRSGIDAIVGFVASIPGRIAGLAGQVSGAGAAIGNAIKRGINSVIGSINSGIGRAESVVPGIHLPRIPTLAKGAIISKPTLAIIGEGKGPEVVVPLTDRGRAQELADQSGLTAMLRTAPPVVNVTAYLGTGQVIEVIRTVVESTLDDEAGSLAGARAA